ncbi:hypothetical protein HMPREF0551_2111 [Lautropia mirabilis ATCC 51599]|uniref:Uncharacterized protein n=1 Tax=Lautropia mirabilis ATCC 51599 TaxID=887898 RepID=E7RZK2_9BURK|nr:hypothetical protein HMPREF0551_2111 [Lautropia mirabilis ATCC 51599]
MEPSQAHPRLVRCAALPTGRAFLIFGVVHPANPCRPVPVGALPYTACIAGRPDMARHACAFFPSIHRRYSSQHIASSSLATPPPGLPAGSAADASFEATGELSTWPLPLRGSRLGELAQTLTPVSQPQ